MTYRIHHVPDDIAAFLIEHDAAPAGHRPRRDGSDLLLDADAYAGFRALADNFDGVIGEHALWVGGLAYTVTSDED